MASEQTANQNQQNDQQSETPNKGSENKKKKLSWDIYKMISKARSNHGIPTGDYDVYRKYLSKQLSILRKKLKMQCLDSKNTLKQQKKNREANKIKRKRLEDIKKGKIKVKRDPNWNTKYKKYGQKKKITWRNREIRGSDLVKDADSMLIALYLCERAWSFSKSIYEEYDEDHKRKFHHSNSRLRKSIFYAQKLYDLLAATADELNISKITICESFGYLCWLKSCFYLQTEEIELSFCEYLKSMKISGSDKMVFLEANGNEKMVYFQQNIDKKDQFKIEQNVNEFIANLKNELNVNDESDDGIVDADDTQKNDESEVFVEYNAQRVCVPNIGKLRQNIASFQSVFNGLNNVKNVNMFKKFKIFTQICLILDKSLKIIQKEVKKFNNMSVQDSGANTVYFVEKYLNFERMRFVICRQCMWLRIEMNKKWKKNEKKMIEIAVLCERQIEMLNELHTINDLTKFPLFRQQIDFFLNFFEISRIFHIAQLYFFDFGDYATANQLFERFVVVKAGDFGKKYANFKGECDESGTFDFCQFVDVDCFKTMMIDILEKAQEYAMLSKANYILQMDESLSESEEANVETQLFDFEKECNAMYPLLTKPIMIDIAWNFIDYHDIFEQDQEENDKHKGQNNQQTSSWFGGLFGNK